MTLTEIDRREVREALVDLDSEPPPRSWGVAGAVLAISGGVVVGLTAVVGPQVGLTGSVAVAALIAGGALLVIGIVLALSARGFQRGAKIAACEAALRLLEDDGADRDEQVRAATLLLTHAQIEAGSVVTLAFDPASARERVGPRMGLVEDVERMLVEEGRGRPIFSDASEGPDS